MLALAVAASAFISCNKQETTPVGTNYKSVEFSLENVNFTKSVTDQVINAGTAVGLTNFQVFFTNGSVLFEAKNADNQTPAKDFFTAEDLTKKLVFHFLDPKVNKVVVLGNIETEIDVVDGVTTLASLEKTLQIAEQQDAQEDDAALSLYGESTLTIKETNAVHKDDDGNAYSPDHTVDVYKADVTLVPRVARIEIVGYECEFSDPALYDVVTIDQVAIDGYNSTAQLATATYGGPVDEVNPANQVDLFNYFKANQSKEEAEWWFDITDIDLTPSANEVTTPLLAYHVFPTAVPELLVDITTTKDGLEMPAYLYTSGFATSADATTPNLTGLEAGKVYRLTLKFKDTDLTQQDKCVEVTVSVEEWAVVDIYPIF